MSNTEYVPAAITLIFAEAGVKERAVRVKMLASELAVATGGIKLKSEHLKSAK